MRLPRLASLVLWLLALSGVAGARAAVDPQAWRVVQSIGDVSITAPQATISKPKPGTVLPAQSVIITGSNGRAILSRQGQQIVVQPNSRLELAPDTGGRTVLRQLGGVASFKVDRRKVPHFQVETPFLAAIVKGTRFEVRVLKDSAEVDVSEGKVEVRSIVSRAATLVTPGALARISDEAPDTIRLQERSGKSRDVTVDEGSLDTGDLRAPDLGSKAPDFKVTVEVLGGVGVGAGTSRDQEMQDGDTGLTASGRARNAAAPRLRLGDGSSGPGNKQETTLRFSGGPASQPTVPPDQPPNTQASSDDDNGAHQPTAQPPRPTQQGGNLFRNVRRDSLELPGFSTRNSFLNTHRLNIQGGFPWWEAGMGALAILSLFAYTAIRSRNKRRREMERKRGIYD